MKFRIKVEEKVNGVKEYTPQVKFNWWDWWWENILVHDVDSYNDNVDTSPTLRYIYESEKEAMKVIDNYKWYLHRQNLKKIKTTKYINI